MAKYILIQVRRDSKLNWEQNNPRLELGEIGVDMTDLKFKVGNGIDLWNELPYMNEDIYKDLSNTKKSISDRIAFILETIEGNKNDADKEFVSVRERMVRVEENQAAYHEDYSKEFRAAREELDAGLADFGQKTSDFERRFEVMVGSMTEDSEIFDARVDAENTTFLNLGQNIRHIHSELLKLANLHDEDIATLDAELRQEIIEACETVERNINLLNGSEHLVRAAQDDGLQEQVNMLAEAIERNLYEDIKNHNKLIHDTKTLETKLTNRLSSIYKIKGSIAAAGIVSDLLTAENEGNVYRVSEEFTSTDDFVEGSGNTHGAGSNILIINAGTSEEPVYKFDVLAGDLADVQALAPEAKAGDLAEFDEYGQVKSCGVKADDVVTKVNGAEENNIIIFDADGKLKNSGVNIDTKITEIQNNKENIATILAESQNIKTKLSELKEQINATSEEVSQIDTTSQEDLERKIQKLEEFCVSELDTLSGAILDILAIFYYKDKKKNRRG